MNEWIEQHREKVIYGLVIALLALLIGMFAMRDSMSKQIAGLARDNAALKESAESRERDAGNAREEAGEYKSAAESAKAESAKLAAENAELSAENAKLAAANTDLSGRVASLDASLSDARARVDRLDFVALTRGKKNELLKSEIAVLKKEAASAAEETSALRRELSSVYGEPINIDSTEGALPSMPGEKFTVALKISDTSGFASMAENLTKTLREISEALGESLPDEAFAFIEALGNFAGATSEMSLLAAPAGGPGVYAAFFADSAAFDDFISRDSGELYALEEWRVAGSGMGWKFFAGGGEKPAFYVRKLLAGGRALILAARDGEGVDLMTRAARGVSPAFEPGRVTSGTDYYQIRFKDGFRIDDLTALLPPALRDLGGSAETLFPGQTDRVLWSVSECSWTRDGNTVSFDSYSDFPERNPEILAPSRAPSSGTEIFGEGELAYYVSADMGFFLRCAFLGMGDPADVIIGLLGSDASYLLSESQIRSLTLGSRLSVACVSDGGDISTAYVMLETDSRDAVDKLYSLAYFMDGRRVSIDGWSGAMSWPLPVPGLPNLTLAKSGGRVMLGIGSEAAFGKKLPVPEGYAEYVSPQDNMMSAVVSSAMVDAAVGVARRAASEMGVSLDDLDEPFVKYFMSSADGLRDSFEAVCGKVTADGNGHGKIVLKEGGDLLGAYIKLLSLGAMSVESSSASGESTRIANDLGKLKLAAVLYYDDNDEWPAPGDVGKLDGYLDEPIVGSGRYEKVIIGPEFKDGGMAVRSNIGVTLGAKDGTERIRKSLESKASGRHLLKGAEGLEPYDGDSMSVFINMR